ncbi:DUF4132 domain-containing protein, partial [Actinomadura rubrisoli]|uniref:DUF4132 domain-containing protein n=1 Tax=Actinomadura rubrisoli TaxID=2530368 RepID=UPI001405111E
TDVWITDRPQRFVPADGTGHTFAALDPVTASELLTDHALAPEERTAWRLTRFEGITVPVGALLALEKRGWERGRPEDNGTQNWLAYPAGCAYVVLSLHWGIQIGDPFGRDEDKITDVWITDRPQRFVPADGTGHTFAALDPVTASELLTDLASLAP